MYVTSMNVCYQYECMLPVGMYIFLYGMPWFSGACVYKKKVYKQGDKWNDGCDYQCECIDQLRGKFRCTDR